MCIRILQIIIYITISSEIAFPGFQHSCPTLWLVTTGLLTSEWSLQFWLWHTHPGERTKTQNWDNLQGNSRERSVHHGTNIKSVVSNMRKAIRVPLQEGSRVSAQSHREAISFFNYFNRTSIFGPTSFGLL